MARFCEGLQEEATRPLDAAERARVDAARRSWTWTAAARALLVPASLLVLVPIALLSGLLPPGAAGVVAPLAAAAVVFVLLPGALLWATAAVRVRRALGQDLAAGEAIRFAGGGRSLVVTPHACRVLERDEVPQELVERAEFGDAAPAPAEPATYGVSADADSAIANRWVRRALAPAERDELRRIAAALARPPLRLLFFSAIFAALAASAFRGGRQGSLALVLAFGLVGVGSGWIRWLRARSLARRLLADEADGWTVRATAGDLAGVELLPGSGAHWTRGGAPADWRVRAGRRFGGGSRR